MSLDQQSTVISEYRSKATNKYISMGLGQQLASLLLCYQSYRNKMQRLEKCQYDRFLD